MDNDLRIETVADYACHTGEGPLWNPFDGRVYWTDIPAGRLFRIDPASGRHETCYHDRPVGGFTLQADGSLLLFRDRGNIVTWRDGRVTGTVVAEVPELAATRFNDVCADPAGRVFCGTMRGPGLPGRLYRLDPDGTLTRLLDGQGTPNGMGFAPGGGRFYYNDSGAGVCTTWVFDYDRASGALAGQRPFREALAHGDPGKPDGLAVDADGGVWTGRWDGGCILRFTPGGEPDRRIDVPARRASSLCFAGPDLSVLFVTTAGGDDRAAYGPRAGALLRVDGHGVRGLPRFVSRVGLPGGPPP